MKLFTGWVISAGLAFTAVAANAQVLLPNGAGRSYVAVSDFDGPYAAMPEEVPGGALRTDPVAGAGGLHDRP